MGAQTAKVRLERRIAAPREQVFRAWTEAGELARWWGPRDFTNPVCEADSRPGGLLRIVMRAPDGTRHAMRGVFREVDAPVRLAFSVLAEDGLGNPLLEGLTRVGFLEEDDATRVTVRSTAAGLAPAAPAMLAGMETGWRQSLERLAALMEDEGRL